MVEAHHTWILLCIFPINIVNRSLAIGWASREFSRTCQKWSWGLGIMELAKNGELYKLQVPYKFQKFGTIPVEVWKCHLEANHSGEWTYQWNMYHLKMYLLHRMGTFHCYFSLLECS